MTTLRNIREELGYTRKYVANYLQINADYLNEIERGQGAMNKDRAFKLAQLYKIDSAEKIINIWRVSNAEKNE